MLSFISTALVIMAIWEGYCEFSMRLLFVAYIIKWLQCSLLYRAIDSVVDEGD